MSNIKPNTPWLNNYGVVKHNLKYPEGTMVDMVRRSADKYPGNIAYDFMGTKATYAEFMKQIEECAKSLHHIGIKPDDRITVAMPNCPQAIIMFYAINMVGAVANMIHPLSAEGEIEFFLKDSNSVAAITLDQFYGKFAKIRGNVPSLKHLIIARIPDALNPILKIGFKLTKGKNIEKIPADADIITWKQFIKYGANVSGEYKVKRDKDDVAVILYSGGTTGVSKGIMLTNLNFNALAYQIDAMSNVVEPGLSMLAVMPIFHGFGLGVCIHTIMVYACKAILMPQLILKDYAKALKKQHPNFIAGVPTLYEALLRLDGMEDADLSCLRGVFSGGDSLSVELKRKIDKYLKDHGATIEVREGFGMTETVTASCLTPYNMSREGSIGFPMPDMIFKVVKPGTTEEVPYGTEGELCMAGPTVMKGYANNPEETADTLRTHEDGYTYVHSGDLGVMDEDGFIYYRQRIKRMIITSGYNVYPSQLENVIDSVDGVLMSCCIGVPDPYKMQKIKAFVMLKPGVEANEAMKEKIMDSCRKNIAKYALPYEIEFRAELPKTLVGKVAYRKLEEEEISKRENVVSMNEDESGAATGASAAK